MKSIQIGKSATVLLIAVAWLINACAFAGNRAETQVIQIINAGRHDVIDLRLQYATATKVDIDRLVPNGRITRIEETYVPESVLVQWTSAEGPQRYSIPIRGTVPSRVERRGFRFEISDSSIAVYASDNGASFTGSKKIFPQPSKDSNNAL